MLILLPPSEGKTAAEATNAPVQFADLSFPELTGERETVLEQLAAVSAQETALEQLKVGASLEAEVRRNTRLLHEPAHAAIQTYTGVLFEALDYGSFSPAERQLAQRTILISSALWGVVRPEDAIPAYRLSMGVKLGELGQLANFWRGALSSALAPVVAGELVLDCRSAAYAKSWVTPGTQTLAVRVERVSADGTVRWCRIWRSITGVSWPATWCTVVWPSVILRPMPTGPLRWWRLWRQIGMLSGWPEPSGRLARSPC